MRKINKKELKEIIENHNMWLKSEGAEGQRADFSNANLSHRDLSGANLAGVKFTGADATCANISECDLRYIDFSNSDLNYTDFTNSNLTGANFTNSNLNNAHLTGANLEGADLEGADLRHAEFNFSDLSSANLTRVKFSRVKLNLNWHEEYPAFLNCGSKFRSISLSDPDWTDKVKRQIDKILSAYNFEALTIIPPSSAAMASYTSIYLTKKIKDIKLQITKKVEGEYKLGEVVDFNKETEVENPFDYSHCSNCRYGNFLDAGGWHCRYRNYIDAGC